MCWPVDEDIGVDLVSNSMPRNRFRDIKQNFHFVDNNEASITTDKMFKVIALLLMKKFKKGKKDQ